MIFREFLEEELERDPEFRREWEENEPAARKENDDDTS